MATVVDGGYCIGCGGCAAVAGSPLRMEMDELGLYRPTISDPEEGREVQVTSVCPFHPDALDEDQLAVKLFPEAPPDPLVGRYLSVGAGHVVKDRFRESGSSGGMTTWLLDELMEAGLIDGVLHVKPDAETMFAYAVSRDTAGLLEGAKSRYYPVQFSDVVRVVRDVPGRYAFVGVPCFVKAMRLLAERDEVVRESIKYCIAIFCGHLKSAAYAQMLAWQTGVAPDELASIDFRHKFDDRPASRYGVKVRSVAGDEKVAPAHGLFGTHWGHGMFKPQACDYCDDVAGELADVSLGDAWLPEYVADPRGTNIVVVRNSEIGRLLAAGAAAGDLRWDELTPRDVYRSQAGNYRHRRDGLAYRLWKKDRAGAWRPRKRTSPDPERVRPGRRRVYDLREELARVSHTAFLAAKRAGSFARFEQAMAPLVSRYQQAYEPAWKRLAKRIRAMMTTGTGTR